MSLGMTDFETMVSVRKNHNKHYHSKRMMACKCIEPLLEMAVARLIEKRLAVVSAIVSCRKCHR